MKVKVLRNLGLGMPSLKEGQEAEVDDELGEKLVRLNLAEMLEKRPMKAVPPEPLKGVPADEPDNVDKATKAVADKAKKMKGKDDAG